MNCAYNYNNNNSHYATIKKGIYLTKLSLLLIFFYMFHLNFIYSYQNNYNCLTTTKCHHSSDSYFQRSTTYHHERTILSSYRHVKNNNYYNDNKHCRIIINDMNHHSNCGSLLLLFNSNRNERNNEMNQIIVNGKEENKVSNNNNNIIGILVLLTVPLSWGTYSPVVKYLYEYINISGFLFSAAYYIVAASTLWILYLIDYNHHNYDNKEQDIEISTVDTSSTNKIITTDQSASMTIDIDHNDILNNPPTSTTISTNNIPFNLSLTTITTMIGGIELGSYLFLGNILQVIGLKTVPADRAGLLVQLTTILVPLISSTTTKSVVSIDIWISCIIAFIGVIIIGTGKDIMDMIYSSSNGSNTESLSSLSNWMTSSSTSSSSFNSGDGFIILAAILYSCHVIRLGKYAALSSSPIQLATFKATTEAFLSTSLVLFLMNFPNNNNDFVMNNRLLHYIQDSGQEINTFISSITTSLNDHGSMITTTTATTIIGATASITASDSITSLSSLYVLIGAILWTGWITCAYTIYAQSYGQQYVTPTNANLIYTIQPIFTTIFAYILLGETLNLYDITGGTCILTAVIRAASITVSSKSKSKNQQIQ